jgi:hypothetical protein
MRILFSGLGGFLGLYLSVQSIGRVIGHATPCPAKAGIHSCFSYALNHELLPTILYILGATAVGMVAGFLAAALLRALLASLRALVALATL